MKHFQLSTLAVAALLASGCATVNFDNTLAQTNRDASSLTQGKLALAQTDAQRSAMQQTANDLLKRPLLQTDAVHIALMNSPALQALLAQSWADAAQAAQSGRIANPLLSLDRMRLGSELELGRLLSFGLLDLLTLPQRKAIAEQRIAASQLQLSSAVVEHLSTVRVAWVNAVAAKQSLSYAAQVNDSAAASAELAKRMLAVGNMNKLSRARQQVFYADAAAQWASANHKATATREALVRALGLSTEQAALLNLPERLPDLPKTPLLGKQVATDFANKRLDLRMAQMDYNAAAKAQGLNTLTSFTDIEAGIRRDTVRDVSTGDSQARRGAEFAIRLPLFDWGGARREAMNAQTLAAANRLEAVQRSADSNLREAYSAYRTGYDIAKHYRDEVVPLRQAISDESVLRYNGMIDGIFELLTDAREQLIAVTGAINAQQQFWLAEANLNSAVLGKPAGSGGEMAAPTMGKSEGKGH
jgi:outer membrane protein TolC